MEQLWTLSLIVPIFCGKQYAEVCYLYKQDQMKNIVT